MDGQALDSVRRMVHAEFLPGLRRRVSAFKRIARDFLVRPARSLPRVPEAISRLEQIDRRTSKIEEDLDRRMGSFEESIERRFAKLDHDLRQLLPFGHDFTRAGVELIARNVLSQKQDWPLSSTAFSNRISANQTAPVPPLTSRARIQGARCVKEYPEDHHFINSGVSDLRAVFNIAGVFGVDLSREISILDFGVGCARMARHLPSETTSKFFGVDVDPVNIAWCTGNMPFGRYETIRPGSTIPAADRSFDLIYSHSVFTHLSPAEQDHWLKELGRVSKGLIILSVHGLYSSFRIAAWSRDPLPLTHWLKDGFVDAGVPNPDISDVVDTEYYRDVAHTPSYIRNRWSSFVDVVEIIPGGFGSVHDAIVLRSKRP